MRLTRESGENPEQSRCCKPHFNGASTKPLRFSGRRLLTGGKVRIPAGKACFLRVPLGLGR